MILKHCITTSCNPLTYLVIVRKFTCHFYWFWHKMASMLPPIIRFDRFALVEKKHDKDVVELKIRFADFRYHKIRTFFNRKRHAKGKVKFSRFLHDAWCLHAKFIAWFSGVPTCAFLKAIRIIWHLKCERQMLFQP